MYRILKREFRVRQCTAIFRSAVCFLKTLLKSSMSAALEEFIFDATKWYRGGVPERIGITNDFF